METNGSPDLNSIVIEHDGVSYKLNELLTVRMLMEVFDVTRMTVYNWLDKKVGDCYPNGRFPNAFRYHGDGKIYIPLNDVKRTIGAKTKGYQTT